MFEETDWVFPFGIRWLSCSLAMKCYAYLISDFGPVGENPAYSKLTFVLVITP